VHVWVRATSAIWLVIGFAEIRSFGSDGEVGDGNHKSVKLTLNQVCYYLISVLYCLTANCICISVLLGQSYCRLPPGVTLPPDSAGILRAPGPPMPILATHCVIALPYEHQYSKTDAIFLKLVFDVDRILIEYLLPSVPVKKIRRSVNV